MAGGEQYTSLHFTSLDQAPKIALSSRRACIHYLLVAEAGVSCAHRRPRRCFIIDLLQSQLLFSAYQHSYFRAVQVTTLNSLLSSTTYPRASPPPATPRCRSFDSMLTDNHHFLVLCASDRSITLLYISSRRQSGLVRLFHDLQPLYDISTTSRFHHLHKHCSTEWTILHSAHCPQRFVTSSIVMHFAIRIQS